MATNNPTGALTLIDDLVDGLKQNETFAARKSNSIVTAIGGIVTLLGTAAAYLVEHETNLPTWFPMIVTVLGFAATFLKVWNTPNGITSSVADRLQTALTDQIDIQHLHELQENPPQSEAKTEQLYPVDVALNLRAAAESIVGNVIDRR